MHLRFLVSGKSFAHQFGIWDDSVKEEIYLTSSQTLKITCLFSGAASPTMYVDQLFSIFPSGAGVGI